LAYHGIYKADVLVKLQQNYKSWKFAPLPSGMDHLPKAIKVDLSSPGIFEKESIRAHITEGLEWDRQ
jgi:hypothetical protein